MYNVYKYVKSIYKVYKSVFISRGQQAWEGWNI